LSSDKDTYWHSGEKLLEVIPGDSLTFGDKTAGFTDNSLQDAVQEFITESDGETQERDAQTVSAEQPSNSETVSYCIIINGIEHFMASGYSEKPFSSG
jgi:hypothetical protein